MSGKFQLDYDAIARMQIEAAIDFFERHDLQGFICAITLAHAAEGILGGLLPEAEKNALNALADGLLPKFVDVDEDPSIKKRAVINKLNLVPNSLKHFMPELVEDEFDPRMSALVSIARAVSNYSILHRGMTQKMDAFHEAWITRAKALAEAEDDAA